jgi:NADPH:quinone reductase-like Zn-dependent oxidoreductase
MKAIVQDRYGSTGMLQLRDVDRPEPGEQEVLVRVHAASVNAYDWHLMRGDPYLARIVLGLTRPRRRIRGRDFAGRVEAVGSKVTRLRPGDEVFGEADGAFAEYVCVADSAVDHKPANLTFEQAAAMPLAGATALVCLKAADAGPGQEVLVNGASGGVGTFAVQIAAALGANVTAVCSTRNVELARSNGAKHVIDYTREDFARSGRRYDVVLDLVANRSLADLRRALTPSGTLTLSGGGLSRGGRPSVAGPIGLSVKGMVMTRLVRQRLVVCLQTPDVENLATLRELAESGKVTPVIERTYPLSEAPEAIRRLERDHARAKIVITVQT